MGDLVAVLGGAGFIGSWTVDLLLEKGYDVRILDSLQPRVHPLGKPDWVPKEAEFIQGSCANPGSLSFALRGVKFVYHLAAYQDYLPEFSQFIINNAESAALLWELVVANPREYPVEKMIFASSQAVCGEGKYACLYCTGEKLGMTGPVVPVRIPIEGDGLSVTYVPEPRSIGQLEAGDWEVRCPKCAAEMVPMLIPEDVVSPGTVYGISKYAIELMADRLGHKYGIPTVCMRYSYVQGPRNSFYNAYSGIARRFALRLLAGLPPVVYEDGRQLRDYCNVKDVAAANWLVLEDPRADHQVFQVGGGRGITVLEFARLMIKEFGLDLEPEVPGLFREGDTRHTVSDISKIRRAVGWWPTIPVAQNVSEYVNWIRTQKVEFNDVERADNIMRQQGVVRQVDRGLKRWHYDKGDKSNGDV